MAIILEDVPPLKSVSCQSDCPSPLKTERPDPCSTVARLPLGLLGALKGLPGLGGFTRTSAQRQRPGCQTSGHRIPPHWAKANAYTSSFRSLSSEKAYGYGAGYEGESPGSQHPSGSP